MMGFIKNASTKPMIIGESMLFSFEKALANSRIPLDAKIEDNDNESRKNYNARLNPVSSVLFAGDLLCFLLIVFYLFRQSFLPNFMRYAFYNN